MFQTLCVVITFVQLWLLMTLIYIYIYIYMLCLKVCVICYKILVCFFFFTNFVEQSEILMADLNKILVLKHRW